MNPALITELEKLAKMLASRNNQPIALFKLPQRIQQPSSPPLRAAERLSETAGPVLRNEMAEKLLENVESFSARQVARVKGELNGLALRIYEVLNLLGCTVAQKRGYNPKAAQVTYFCPAEAICAYLGISRGSFYRSLKELLALGLVDSRGHKTTLKGWTVRCDGTLWCVKLLPTAYSRARLRFEDLKASYRDLGADIEAGNTVWRQMRQSKTDKQNQMEFKELLTWALSPDQRENPVTLTVASEKLDLEILLDVPGIPKQGRRTGVDRAAQALAQHLGDVSSINFYRHLVWQLLRLVQQGRERFSMVYQLALRARADLMEGFARKAGALFVSRLKACALWDELREVPLVQVSI
jgi:hypothetical protein